MYRRDQRRRSMQALEEEPEPATIEIVGDDEGLVACIVYVSLMYVCADVARIAALGTIHEDEEHSGHDEESQHARLDLDDEDEDDDVDVLASSGSFSHV